ncbi:hypothetical protein CMU55_19270 [Elizabethkingia anophelis]|nr:hypothetical protein [Elizabethkingia anophelis]
MSEFKGTKGKWEFHESKGLFITTVGAIFRKDKSRLEQVSNARLISKAPEMLEMLSRVLDCQAQAHTLPSWLNEEIESLIKEATE